MGGGGELTDLLHENEEEGGPGGDVGRLNFIPGVWKKYFPGTK